MLKRKCRPKDYCKKTTSSVTTKELPASPLPNDGKPAKKRMTKMEREQKERKSRQDDFLLFLEKERKKKEKEKEEEEEKEEEV